MSRDSSSVLKMSIKEIAEDYEKKWVNDEFLYVEDAIEAAIIKFIELRGVAEATDLKALADQLEAMVLHHAQQIKDIAKHLLELKRLVTPPMIMDDDDLNNVRYKANYRYETKWVGLTEEEIKDIVGRNDPGGIGRYTRDLFKKIEDKLREKNG